MPAEPTDRPFAELPAALVDEVLQCTEGLSQKLVADFEQIRARRQEWRSTILKRLGFLLELFALGTPSLLVAMQDDLGSGYTALDPLYPPEGQHTSRWRLVVNVPERDLLDWREH